MHNNKQEGPQRPSVTFEELLDILEEDYWRTLHRNCSDDDKIFKRGCYLGWIKFTLRSLNVSYTLDGKEYAAGT